MSQRLAGKAIFVTGATRGIGRAIALACANEGATVGLGFRATRPDVLGPTVIPLEMDVTDAASVKTALSRFAEQAGGLDAVVCNAGIHVAGLLATADPAQLRRLVDTNVLGPLHCSSAALPLMLPRKRGLLLFVGSVAASRPARGQAAYAATKGSVEALTRAIAVEYGRKGIRAICIRPGAVETDMLEATLAIAGDEVVGRIPARRIAKPEEIASVAAMLLSDDAAYMNGAIVDVDGGYVSA
jgi:3-oxoacyl-[acyl-carrier protein] reductase